MKEEREDTIRRQIIDRIDIRDYLKTFMREQSKRDGRIIVIKDGFDAMRINQLMNKPENTTFKSAISIGGGVPYWHFQKVTCLRSNLGLEKGYVFYFICYSCEKRAKYLYFESYLETPVCRKCSGLPYRSQYKYRKRWSHYVQWGTILWPKSHIFTKLSYAQWRLTYI